MFVSAEALPIVGRATIGPGAFGEWQQEQRHRVSAKSRLGEKLAYIHRHWDGLQTFLHDGRVEIDSNSVENLIRPIALNRNYAHLVIMCSSLREAL